MATFIEQIACATPGYTTTRVALETFPRALFGFVPGPYVTLITWTILVGLFVILYFLVPPSFANSYNGFTTPWVSTVWAVAFTWAIYAAIAFWYHDQACTSKVFKAAYHVYGGRKPEPPLFLRNTIANRQALLRRSPDLPMQAYRPWPTRN